MDISKLYNITPENILEVRYIKFESLDLLSNYFASLSTAVKENPLFINGVEFLFDLTGLEKFSAAEQSIVEHFAKETKIIRAAAYGVTDEIIRIGESLNDRIQARNRTHYFKTRDEALEWIMAERLANNEISNTDGESTLSFNNSDFIEIKYAAYVDEEKQNRTMSALEEYVTKNIINIDSYNFLIDLAETKTFTDGAEARTEKTLKTIPVRKIALLNSAPHIKIVRDVSYKENKISDKVKHFDYRQEAIDWLRE